jgi:hypothetical protein
MRLCLKAIGYAGFQLGFGRNMRNFVTATAVLFVIGVAYAQAQPTTPDPESIVPLSDKFDMDTPSPDRTALRRPRIQGQQ